MKKIFSYYKYCWRYFDGYRYLIVIGYSLTGVNLLLGMAIPLLSSRLITALTIKNIKMALIYVGFLVLCQVIIMILRHFIVKCEKRANQKISNNIKEKLFTEILEIEPDMMVNYGDGKIYSILERDSGSVVSFVYTILNSLLNVITVLFIAIIICFLCYPLALIIFATYPLLYLINRYFGGKLKRQQIELMEKNDRYTGFIKNIVTSLNDIKGIGGAKRVRDKFIKENENIKECGFKMEMTRQWNSNFSGIIGLINYISINVIGIIFVIFDRLLLGNFVAFTSYTTTFTSSLNGLVSLNAGLQPTYVVLDRLQALDKLYEKYKGLETLKRTFDEGGIKGDSLALQLSEHLIFKNVSFDIAAGQTLKVLGKNGGGKTSLLRIIKKEITYTGTLKLGSIDLQNIKYTDIQKKILFLRQNPTLINLSLLDNLLLFDSNNEISEERIIEACKRTKLWEDIQKFPNGLYTNIDEGVKFSAGQVQKVQLSRALLSNASIILCDEIVANLDAESQVMAINILTELHNKGKTIFFISHQSDIFNTECKQLKFN